MLIHDVWLKSHNQATLVILSLHLLLLLELCVLSLKFASPTFLAPAVPESNRPKVPACKSKDNYKSLLW